MLFAKAEMGADARVKFLLQRAKITVPAGLVNALEIGVMCLASGRSGRNKSTDSGADMGNLR